jgi:hypothetical protein
MDSEVQMEIFPSSFQTQPPMIVRHLLQVNESATGNNFVKCWPSIRQFALCPNLQDTAVLFPNQITLFDIGHASILALPQLLAR